MSALLQEMGLLTATQKEAEAGFSLNLFIKILWVSHFLLYGLSLLLCMESQLLECKCSHPVSLLSTAAASEPERPPGGLSTPPPLLPRNWWGSEGLLASRPPSSWWAKHRQVECCCGRVRVGSVLRWREDFLCLVLISPDCPYSWQGSNSPISTAQKAVTISTRLPWFSTAEQKCPLVR